MNVASRAVIYTVLLGVYLYFSIEKLEIDFKSAIM